MWYLIIGFIVVIVLFSSKKSSEKTTEVKDVGMYFMDLEKQVNKSEYSDIIQLFYYLLGCASQGRIGEVNHIYKDAKEENDLFYKLIENLKPQIMKMTKIAKQVEDSSMEDMKTGESIGEYQSRKLMKRKAFMVEFNYFKNLDLNNYLKTI